MKGIKFQFQGINNKIQQLLIKAQSPKAFIFSFKKIILETFNVFNIFLQESETDASITQAFFQVNQKMKKAVHLHNISAFGDEDSEEQSGNYHNVDYQIDQVAVFLNSRKPIHSDLQGRGQFYKFLSQAEGREKDLQEILENCNNNNPTGKLKNSSFQRAKSNNRKTKVNVQTVYENRQIQTDMSSQAIQLLFNQHRTYSLKQKNMLAQAKQSKKQQLQESLRNNLQQATITINIIRNQKDENRQNALKQANVMKKGKNGANKKVKGDQEPIIIQRNSKQNHQADLNLGKKTKQSSKNGQNKLNCIADSLKRNTGQNGHKRNQSDFNNKNNRKSTQSNIQMQQKQYQYLLQKQRVRQQYIQTDPLKELKQLRQIENQIRAMSRNKKSFSEVSNSSEYDSSSTIKRNLNVRDIQRDLINSNFNKSRVQFSKSIEVTKDALKNSQQQRNIGGSFYVGAALNGKLPTLSTYEVRKPQIKKIKIKQNFQYTSQINRIEKANADENDNKIIKAEIDEGVYNTQKGLKETKKQSLGLLPSLSNTNSPNYIGMKSQDRNKILNSKANFTSIHEGMRNNPNNNEVSRQNACDNETKKLTKKMQEKQKRIMKDIEGLVQDTNANKNRRRIQMYIQFIEAMHERECGKSCIHLSRFYQFLKRNNIPHRQQVIMHRKNINFEEQINKC